MTTRRQPSVTTCLIDLHTTIAEAATLRRRLASVATQAGPATYGLLVVSAMDQRTARTLIAEELGAAAIHWHVLAQPGIDSATARRVAAQTAHGEYLLMLDGTLATPQAMTILREAAARTEATAFTWISDEQEDDELTNTVLARWIPLGGCTAAGLFRNCFGGPGWLVRRDALLSIGDPSIGDDHALLAKLILSGQRLEVVPAVLSQRVRNKTQSNDSTSSQRDLSPYEQATPRELWPALLFARSLFTSQKQAGLSPNMSQVLSELVRLEHELRRYPRLYDAARQLFVQGLRVSRSVLGKKRRAGESTLGH